MEKVIVSLESLGLGAIGMPLCLAIYVKHDRNCTLEIAAEFFCQGFGHLIAYITAIVGYDCYFSMKYLTEYQRIVKRWKVYVALAAAAVLSFGRSGMHTLGDLIVFIFFCNFLVSL